MSLSIAERPHGAGHRLTITGAVSRAELKRGLLTIVRENGWADPVLWDFREVTDIQLNRDDLAETIQFIRTFMGHFPSRGRIALVVRSPQARAAAMTYRDMQPAPARSHVAVFDSIEAAEAWLDAGHGSAPQLPRAMRIALRGAVASVRGEACDLDNISHTGALLVTSAPAEPGEEWLLTLRAGNEVIDLRVRVVRTAEAPPGGSHGMAYQVAVLFLEPEEALMRINTLVNAHLG